MVADAIVVWTGWRDAQSPRRDDSLVLRSFGDQLGADLVDRVRLLQRDFYSSDAFFTAPDLVTMGRRAAQEFTARHPELPKEAVDALEWCYTFDNR